MAFVMNEKVNMGRTERYHLLCCFSASLFDGVEYKFSFVASPLIFMVNRLV